MIPRAALFGKWLCAVLAGLALSGCADRQGSVDAATALAEAVYPGQLELFDTHMQKDHYDVTFAVKGDPFTRVRFGVDPDPGRCRLNTPCEERLRRAYATGMAAGAKLKALNAALEACRVTVLGMHDSHITTDFTTVIELDLGAEDQQPELDRLTQCVAAFRAGLPEDAAPGLAALRLRILLPGARGPAASKLPLTFETRLDGSRTDEINFLIGIGPDETGFRAEDLRINPNFFIGSDLRERLAEEARRTLAGTAEGGFVPKMSFLNGTRLDPQRRDVLRTYILACSEREAGQGPCKTDIAVYLRYDLAAGAVTERAVLRDIGSGLGNLTPPELPGRGIGP